ncbi:hypothetical protein PR003_g8466 [Phytophthora rubi]|uniref:Secreted protein n=1 Tax=Phytophthora rubi TaxID=129364 RepID=A0A6A3MN04_9STRA|nr:hypothetical protein PR002_g9968 [Phytophthora rubi]KAE9042826.1 hypothetical protein PR001_g6049 [Phytophthora rubi]KAE9344463.1 hypothetical protein PR003_g8466 [Phytophthora rubi]
MHLLGLVVLLFQTMSCKRWRALRHMRWNFQFHLALKNDEQSTNFRHTSEGLMEWGSFKNALNIRLICCR